MGLDRFVVNSTGQPFNDAYRYVDWLLTVPLLLIELILVMQLPAEESSRKMWTLGTASAFMVAFGYPGEIRDDPAGRWFYWSVSMCPFMYVLYELRGPCGGDVEARAVGGVPDRVGAVPDGDLVAHVPLRVHAEGPRPLRR